MSGLPYLQHSQSRATPSHVVRDLREIDPTADLYYLGWKKWVLVSVRPHIDHQHAALRMVLGSPASPAGPARPGLRFLLRRWEVDPKLRQNPGAFRQLLQKYEMALLMAQGARPIAEYVIQGEPTSAIVDDFRRMDWMYRNISDDQLDRMLNAPYEQGREAARADIRDEARARDAWRYMHTLNIAPGISLTPKDRVRSGFTRHSPSPAVNGSPS
jgi:hypothetical protein